LLDNNKELQAAVLNLVNDPDIVKVCDISDDEDEGE